jgi:hypothetical protein
MNNEKMNEFGKFHVDSKEPIGNKIDDVRQRLAELDIRPESLDSTREGFRRACERIKDGLELLRDYYSWMASQAVDEYAAHDSYSAGQKDKIFGHRQRVDIIDEVLQERNRKM